MDPDKALEEIRELVNAGIFQADDHLPHEVQEMAEKFTALDEWLCKGGFVPRAWRKTNWRTLGI